MTGSRPSRESFLAAARRHLNSGISNERAALLGWAEASGSPLDPAGFEDSAIILRAERLVAEGFGVEKALELARREQPMWRVTS